MANKIRFFTDSTVDIPPEIVQKYDLTVLPLHIFLNDKEYLDGVDIHTDELYAFARETKTLPRTAGVSPEMIESAFRQALDEGDDVIYTGISAGLSSTFQTACMVCENLVQEGYDRARMEMVDSAQLSTGIAHLLIQGIQKAQTGTNVTETAAFMRDIVPRINVSFVLDTLEFMKMGGRCSTVAYLATSVLRIHPQISVIGGKLQMTDKFRGNIDACYEQYFKKQVVSRLDRIEPERIFVTATASEETVRRLVKEVEDLGYFREVIGTHAGSTIASHCGPGCMGYLFIMKEEK